LNQPANLVSEPYILYIVSCILAMYFLPVTLILIDFRQELAIPIKYTPLILLY